MELIPWREEFALGISEIDEQHKKILAIINNLSEIFQEKKHHEQGVIDQIIQELNDYANYHFQTEEKYFDLFNYQDAEAHIKIHNQYREKISEWRQQYEKENDPKIFFDVSEFLKNWWVWHINNTDRAYVPLLKENGLK